MLSCIYNGKPFTTKENGFSTKDKYDLGKQKLLLCPICKTSVFFCEEGEKIAHFTHHKAGDCPLSTYRSYDYTSSQHHDNLVEKFVVWVKNQFPKIYPDYFINDELFTDIYFELDNIKIAIEIQFKNFNNNTFLRRRVLYKKNNIKDIWFFVQQDGDYSIGSPYQRTYYRSNKRELYFYEIKEQVCKVYKGFASEKWEEVGKNTLYNSSSVKVPLEHIEIQKDGTLYVPELKRKYYQVLIDKRKKNKDKREQIKREKEQRQIQLDEYIKNSRNHGFVPSSEGSHTIANNKSGRAGHGDSINKSLKYSTVIQEKPNNQEYKQYQFVIENGKEYLDITIIYQGKDYRVKYLILDKAGAGREFFLTCRKESEPNNIKYSIIINPILDAKNQVKIFRNELR
jgi:competence CoiA-like predicted nuclease